MRIILMGLTGRERQKLLRNLLNSSGVKKQRLKIGCEKMKRMNAEYIIRPGEQLNNRGINPLFSFPLSFPNH